MGEKTFKIVDGDISDGYHTFTELYEHRCLLFIAWMVSAGRPGKVFWVKDHFDGWDLIVCESLAIKQISYHVPSAYRELYSYFPEKTASAHTFDGHTSADVVKRIKAWVKDGFGTA